MILLVSIGTMACLFQLSNVLLSILIIADIADKNHNVADAVIQFHLSHITVLLFSCKVRFLLSLWARTLLRLQLVKPSD